VVKVRSGIGSPINVNQGLWIADVSGAGQGQIKGHGDVWLPIKGNLKTATQDEISISYAPISIRVDHRPIAVVDVQAQRRNLQGTVQGKVAKRGQWLASPVDQRFNEAQALGNFFGGPANFMSHCFTISSKKIVYS
jgi:hypothetical protein